MKQKFYLFIITTLLSTITSFSQVLDQNHINFSSGAVKGAVTFGQSFTAGLSGRFSQFDFLFYDGGAYNYKCELKIYAGTGNTGTLLKTQPFIISQNVRSGIAQIVINDGPTVVAGSIYSAVITVLSGPPDGKMLYPYITNYPNYQDGTPTDSYPGGVLLFNTDTYSQDMGFKTYVSEAPANHLNFDGVNDCVTIGSLIALGSSYTKEAMIKPNAVSSGYNILSSSNDVFWIYQNYIRAGHTSNFSHVFAPAALLLNSWNHVAVTYDAPTTTMKLYVNGNLVSQNNNVQAAVGNTIQIGAYASSTFFSGGIDEVRIWNFAKTAAEINASKACELSGSESGLLAYYKFNQGMGFRDNTSITSLTDASSNSNNGVFNGFALNGITSNFVTTDGFNAPSLPTLNALVILSQTDPVKVVSTTSGSLLWYTTATGGTASTTPTTLDFSGNGSASYWISAINSRGCETDRVALVVVNAAAIPTTPTALPIQLYKGEGTLANLTATGTNLEWFSASIGGTALALSTVLVDNTTYYVSQSPQGVRSPRISVKAKKISASTQVFCSSTTVADLISTPSTGAAVKWYANTTDSTPLANLDAVNTGSLYVEQSISSATTSIGTGFSKPGGIFVDASGSVYVADTYNNAVKKMDSNGTMVTLGTGLYRPLDVTVDVLGNIYVFDSNLKGIVKMDSQGNNKELIYEFGGAPVEYTPRLFTDQLGNIYMYYNYTIKKMDNNGGNVQQIINTVYGITAMALDKIGNIYVVRGIELQKIDAVTGTVSIIGSDFSSFYGIRNLVVDQLGTIYYIRDNDLKKINNDGTNIQVVAAGVGYESGLSIDEFGSIYWSSNDPSITAAKKISPKFTSNRVAIAMTVETLTVPTFSAPVFIQGATATALTATSSGTGLLWYSAATGGTGSTTAPTPSTATVGTTSYWVSSTSNNGCESARVEMVVTTNPPLPATHLNFDGVNDYVELPNEATFDFTNQMTVEFWMNSNVTPQQWDALVAKGDGSWRVSLTAAGKINFAGSGSFGDVTSNEVVTDGTWKHVAVTYNGSNAIIYIDGMENNRLAGTGNIANSSYKVSIGENLQATGRNYKGNIDEVRLWNVARTATQINVNKNCELQGNETGLLAYYKFNQGDGAVTNTTITTLTDVTANGNNGTLTGFALTGTSSNFLSGSPIITGNSCTTLSNTSFDIANNTILYPNPTKGKINITVNNLTNVSVSVYDLNGRELLNKKVSAEDNSINISNFQSGVYLFKIKSQEGETIKKVLKN